MSADLAIIPMAGTVDAYADPAMFVELALTRSKEWLAEAVLHGEIDQIVELKSQAEAIRVYTLQKQLGKDVQLNAREIVRRAEHGLGLAIRKGQAEGAVKTTADRGVTWANQYGNGGVLRDAEKTSPLEFFNNHAEQTDAYAMTDGVSEERFEEVIAEAREEGNLSRANVVRKCKGETGTDRVKVARDMAERGHTSDQIAVHLGYSRDGMRNFMKRHGIQCRADELLGRAQGMRLDSNKIVEGVVASVTDVGIMLPYVNYTALNPEKVNDWLTVLNESIKALNALRTRLKEINQS